MDQSNFIVAAAALVVGSLGLVPCARAQINLLPGDVAIIGWVDNGAPQDVITIVALEDLPAGTILGFTDNGWDSTAGGFRNTAGPHDGNGNEELMLFTALTTIPRGTIVSTNDAGPAFAWTTTGAIVGTGVTSGSYGAPNLAQSGDQVYAFQHSSGDNILNTPTIAPVFVLDDTGTFESATSTATGAVPPGLSAAAHTAITFAQSGSGQDFMAFDTAALAHGSKAQWLAAIGDPAHWTFGASGTLPSGSIAVDAPLMGDVFCAGDANHTACPCGNASPVGADEGCLSSLGMGAKLRASGQPSLAVDDVVLTGTQMPNSSALFFQGTTQQSGGAGAIFGDGLRCASGSIVRLATRVNVNAGSHYPIAGEMQLSHKGNVSVPGVRTYQIWFRNAAAFCTPSTFNLSNGLSITWTA
jgi:hypothetical protein